MATLAENFLADLDELSEGEEEQDKGSEGEEKGNDGSEKVRLVFSLECGLPVAPPRFLFVALPEARKKKQSLSMMCVLFETLTESTATTREKKTKQVSPDAGRARGDDATAPGPSPRLLRHQQQQQPRSAAAQSSDDLSSVAKLEATTRYKSIMARVSEALSQVEKEAEEEEKERAANKGKEKEVEAGPSMAVDVDFDAEERGGDDEYEPEADAVPELGNSGAGGGGDDTYALLVECNALAVDIDAEVEKIASFLRLCYRSRFPELESLVPHPLDYARVVRALGCEAELEDAVASKGCLDGILPQATIMVVSVTASTTAGSPLDPASSDPHTQQLRKNITEAAEAILRLDAAKGSILRLVEARMSRVAPNLSHALGARVAARLVGVAGGLAALSRLPAGTIQILGAPKRAGGSSAGGLGLASSARLSGAATLGAAAAAAASSRGFVFDCELISLTPPPLRTKAARLVASKAALLARVDASLSGPASSGGSVGRRFREEMLRTIARWQEPPPARTAKVLPVPDEGPTKRRGGRRARALKERFGLTDVRQAANRVAFGHAEEEVTVDDETVGLGMLGGKSGAGSAGSRLRVAARVNKATLSAKQQKKYSKWLGPGAGSGGVGGGTMSTLGGVGGAGGAGAVSGLASSLAFTPVQGIELVDPARAAAAAAAAADKARGGTESYFSSLGGFKSARPQQPK